MLELCKKQTNKTQYVRMSKAFRKIYLHHQALYNSFSLIIILCNILSFICPFLCNLNWLLNLNLIYETLWTGTRCVLLI